LTQCTTDHPWTVVGMRRVLAIKSPESVVLAAHPEMLSACQFVADGLVQVKCVPSPLRSSSV